MAISMAEVKPAKQRYIAGSVLATGAARWLLDALDHWGRVDAAMSLKNALPWILNSPWLPPILICAGLIWIYRSTAAPDGGGVLLDHTGKPYSHLRRKVTVSAVIIALVFGILVVAGSMVVWPVVARRSVARVAAQQTPPATGPQQTVKLGMEPSIKVEKRQVVPMADGPKILLEYAWRSGSRADDGKKIVLLNDGTEAALNVQIDDVQRGSWMIKFPRVPMIEKGKRVAITPSELLQLSPPPYTRPYTKRNPQFASFLRKVINDRNIPGNVDPIDITVRILYGSASTSEKLESHNVVEYFRSRKRAESRFLVCGKPVVVP